MRVLSEAEARAAFGGCSAGERKRLRLPDLAALHPDETGLLTWTDRSNPGLGYLIFVDDDDRVSGLVLRAVKPASASARQSMCNFCRTIHSIGGVALFSTPKWGAEGQRGDAVGEYVCVDLACVEYIRGRKSSGMVQLPSSLSVDERLAQLRERVAQLVQKARGLV